MTDPLQTSKSGEGETLASSKSVGDLSIPSVYHDLDTGISLLWSNDFGPAEEFFAKRKAINPRHSLHHAEAALLRSVITEMAVDRKSAMDRLDATIDLAESHYKAYSDGKLPKGVNIPKTDIPSYLIDSRIVIADAHSMLAALQILEESRVKGFLNLRKAWKVYKDTIAKSDMNKADPMVVGSLKFGAGLFYFIISMIPPGIAQRAASLAGFKGGDRELGLQYLKDCYNGNTPRSHLAGLVLAANHIFLNLAYDPENSGPAIAEVDEILAKALKQFPKGSIFQAFGSLAALERNKVQEAIGLANESIENCNHITAYPVAFLRILSNCYAMSFDWKACLGAIQQVMDKEKQMKSKNVWSFPWNNIRSGACCIMLDDPAGAKKFFKICADVSPTDSWSEMMKVQAEKFINNGGHYSMFELMHMTGHLQKIAVYSTPEKNNEIIALLDKIAAKAPGSTVPLSGKKAAEKPFFSLKSFHFNDVKVDNRTAYLVLRGTIELYLKKHDVAEQLAQEVINFQHLMLDKTYYVMALILHAKAIQPTRPADAIKELQQAATINDYSWESSIKSQIRKLLETSGAEAKFDNSTADAELDNDPTLKEMMQDDDK